MDYRAHLQHPLSLRFIDKLVDEVFLFPIDFPIVYQLTFDSDDKVSWRAAWACQKISEKHPEWFSTQHFIELAKLSISTHQGGLQRGCLSILNNLPFPDPIPVDLINACFDWMISAKSPIAVQALSMKLLVRICKSEPDFVPEFIAYLENVDYESYSPGFKSTRKNALKMLKKN
jgi:hypothetical protein